MQWVVRILLTLGLALVLAILGGWLGLELGVAWNRGAFSQWRQLPNPPAPASRIAAGSTDAVLIEATDGNYYLCQATGDSCWTTATGNEMLEASGEDCAEYPTDYALSAPPEQPVDFLETHWCHFEAGSETNYALMADGDVWVVTHFGANFLDLARGFGPMLVGFTLGTVGGLLISVAFLGLGRLHRRDQKNPSQP
jgi:hypothetical protein